MKGAMGGSEEIKKVKFVHEDEQDLHAHDEDGEHSLLLLPQVAAQTAWRHRYLRMPFTRKAVERKKAAKRRAVWMSTDLMKHRAVIGRKAVRLYP
jgi:hypothetical protein